MLLVLKVLSMAKALWTVRVHSMRHRVDRRVRQRMHHRLRVELRRRNRSLLRMQWMQWLRSLCWRCLMVR